MQKIKVAKVSQKPVANGGTMVLVEDDKGARFSGFDKSLQEIKEGDIINAEIQVDGKYNNIKSFELVEHGTLTKTEPPEPKDKPYQVEIEARARNTALMQACEIAKASSERVTLDKILFTADAFYWWLVKLPSDAPEPQIKPIKAESSAVTPEVKDEMPITTEQFKHLTGWIKERGISLVALGQWMKGQGWAVGKLESIKQGQYNKIIEAFEKGAP